MHYLPRFLLLFLMMSPTVKSQGLNGTQKKIEGTLEKWHRAAADADYEAYFDLMTEDAVFIGTDAEENWNRSEFEAYAKPHFDRGKAWNFTALERHIFLSDTEKMAWFDELLDTQMGLCRGSGVLKLENGTWKIEHYVLSITVPNENIEQLNGLKQKHDRELITKLKK